MVIYNGHLKGRGVPTDYSEMNCLDSVALIEVRATGTASTADQLRKSKIALHLNTKCPVFPSNPAVSGNIDDNEVHDLDTSK